MRFTTPLKLKGFRGLLPVALLCMLPFSGTVHAQSGGTIPAGTNLSVRTLEEIKVDNSDGRVFSGSVDEDILDRQGRVAVPRGTYVELLVRNISGQYALDLEAIIMDGERFGVEAQNSPLPAVVSADGIGANSRTGTFVGGGAVIGAIIGAIAGGGKGALIGGGVGAAAGAGTQIVTRGKSVYVPSETLVNFRLELALQTGVQDRGFSRNGQHYHAGYGTSEGNTPPYDDGLKAGRADRSRNREFDSRTSAWDGADLRSYEAGYERGFDESPDRPPGSAASIRIGSDHYITWEGPTGSRVYISEDNNPRRLFASGRSGSQPAPWISYGHQYLVTLEDGSGREIARDENDLRQNRQPRR